MRTWVLSGALAAAALSGCVGTPSLQGTLGAPSFGALQEMCGTAAVNYGQDAQSVYSAFYDAYVAQKHGALPKDRYCAFQASIASRYGAFKANPSPQAQSEWANFFLDRRSQALSWRADVDPTLRGG